MFQLRNSLQMNSSKRILFNHSIIIPSKYFHISSKLSESSSANSSSSSSFFSMPTRASIISSVSSAIGIDTNSLQNGILSKDDYYTKGIPLPKFKLNIPFKSIQSNNQSIINSVTHEINQNNSITIPLNNNSSSINSSSTTNQFYNSLNTIPSNNPSISNDYTHLNYLFSLHNQYNSSINSDPFELVKNDLKNISQSIKQVIGSDHPILSSIAKYFFDVNGKRIRPMIVLLLSRAMAVNSISIQQNNSNNNSINTTTTSTELLSSQYRLSEITEMIHTASLLHDDVIDDSSSRRGIPSVNKAYGNKFAILGGDFLLARASLALSRLRNPEVVELMSTSLEHLVKGEIMQLRSPKIINDQNNNNNNNNNNSNSNSIQSNFDQLISLYNTKTYYKTGSLIANSCQSVAILGSHNIEIQEIAFEYGKSLGLAFQIIDDLLDMEGTMEKMGKSPLTDLKLGLATAPVLYASLIYPELNELINRKFSSPGDIELTLKLVKNSNGIQRSRELAYYWGENAVAAILKLPNSPYQSALIRLVQYVLNRES